MSDKEKMLNYILTLTPEQIDKIVNRLPELLASDEELLQLFPQEQT